jgi:hypothetical protein
MVRDVVLHPVNLVTIPVGVLTWLGREHGFVANAPLWLLLGSLLLAHAVSIAFALTFPPGTRRARPRLHLATEMAMIGLVIYTMGWGAALGVGFVFCAAGHMSVDGSRMGRPAVLFSALAIAAGEIAITLGWIQTLQPEPQGHGLAVLEAAGVGAVIWLISFSQNEKEMVETSLRRGEERLRRWCNTQPTRSSSSMPRRRSRMRA